MPNETPTREMTEEQIESHDEAIGLLYDLAFWLEKMNRNAHDIGDCDNPKLDSNSAKWLARDMDKRLNLSGRIAELDALRAELSRWNNEWDAWAKQGVDLNCRGTVIEELANLRAELAATRPQTDDAGSPNLLPCPFCGGEPVVTSSISPRVLCSKCKACGPQRSDRSDTSYIDRWNAVAKRHSLASLRPQTDDANVIDCALLAAITSSLTDGTPGPGTPGLREARKRFQAMVGEIERLKAEGERVRARLAKVEALIRDVEWSSFTGDESGHLHSSCPSCRQQRRFKSHSDGCKLAAALAAEPENPVAPPG